ncbi:MAG TPA: hypothetical protein DEG92_07070, partial [Rikenellaceae bacterium]|nr:hypothetical protein [Rikenellaceae bacterium]
EDASPGPAGAGGQLAAADSGSPYSFTGKEYDEDLGLYYFEARYYNPELGRFVGMDPMQHQDFSRFLNDPQAFNGYSYARNNPLVYVDPSGEMFVDSGNIFWLTVSAYLEYSKPFSASWLRHSINWGEGDPSNLYYGNRSSLAGSIRNSNDYAQLKDKILEDIRTSNDGHTVFNFQSNDLSTSLGGVEIYYEIYENEDDKYANITISDNYNFELDLAYENIVTAIGNNIAVVSEGINDLNSFGITIKLTNVKFDDEN